MEAIVLTFGRQMKVAEFVIGRYFKLWPRHPFAFRVPYNDIKPSSLDEKYKDKVELVQSPKP